MLGEEQALELARAGEQIIPGIRAWAEARGEDVWLREAGMLEVSAAPAQDGAVEKAVAAAARVGRADQAVALTPDEVAQRISSPVFRGGVFYPECATVHPGLLVRALRRAALDAGVTLHEGTPVTAVRAGSPNELETPGGILRAPEVVLATNAALTGWKPAVAQPDELRLVRRADRAGARAARRDRLDRRRGDRRRADVPPLLPHDERRARAHGQRQRADRLRRRASTTASRATSRRPPAPRPGCGGCCRGSPASASSGRGAGRSTSRPTTCPFFRTKPGTRIHYGAGYSGHGVGPAWLGGRILASLALGADDEWTRLPLATRYVPRLPPEPFRRVGGGLVRWAIMACEAAEEEGRRPPLAARPAAALPRLLGMELGTR